MKTESTELQQSFINPSFVEMLKLSPDAVRLENFFSFSFTYKSRDYRMTLYDDGNVTISRCPSNGIGMDAIILRDKAVTIEDFKKVWATFQEVSDRFELFTTPTTK